MVIPVGTHFLTQYLMLVNKAQDGSISMQQILPVRKERRSVVLVVGSIGAIAVLYLVLLPALFQHLFNMQAIYKIGVSIALIAPLALPMGVLFPLGLAGLASTAQALLPWAWGINACASVVAAILATAMAIHLGFTAVVIAALLLYGLAAMAYGSSFCR